MKSKILKIIGLEILLLVFTIGFLYASSTADIKGTWNYEAQQAPPEYSKGKLIFTENNGKLEGVIKLGEYTVPLLDVKAEGNEVSFGTNVEGEYVSVKLTFADKTFTGTASSSAGIINLTGKKEE